MLQRIATLALVGLCLAVAAFLVREVKAARGEITEMRRTTVSPIGERELQIDLKEKTVTTHSTTFTCCGDTHTTTTTGSTEDHAVAVARDKAKFCDCEQMENLLHEEQTNSEKH